MRHTTVRPGLRALFFALILIAAAALWTSASAQIKLNIGGNAAAPAMDVPAVPVAISSAAGAGSNVVTTPRVRAELVALAPDGIQPGKSFELGLLLDHQPDWHTYWLNAGDSGLATQLDWSLPPSWDAGEIRWPTPHPIRIGSLVNYGYEGRILLPVTVQVPTTFSADAPEATVRLKASWLICRVECIPEEGTFTLGIPTKSSTAMAAADFAAAKAQAPVALPAASQATVAGDTLQLRVAGLPAALRQHALQVLPETPNTLHHAMELGKDFSQAWEGDVWTATVPLSAARGATPTDLPLVLATAEHTKIDGAVGWRTVAPISGQWQAVAMAEVSPALAAALAKNEAEHSAALATAGAGVSGGLWVALLGGLLGGLILNLMPCVFPILAIKVLGFAEQGNLVRQQRTNGLAYTAGVVLSFLALGALLLGLRAAGQQLGWGFQLQSPVVVALLAALFTVIGLNLAGVFEFGNWVPSSLAGKQIKNPAINAFFSGVLAVAIASPCTAPFMGASMGLAVSMPTAQALLVFAALGVGMALPYLLASWVPAVVRWLPRPGAWMDTFRRAMAFPMFATVVWLVWVLGQQSGIDGAATLLALLVMLAALVWALGLQGRTRWVISMVLIAGTAYLVGAIGQNITNPAPQLAANVSQPGERWQAWSADKVASINATGKSVFVDFTAAWCVTCQYNKRNALSDADVLAAFDRQQVTLLRADWTRQDPAITAALKALGRSGVPVYVLYAPGQSPVVLSEVLSAKEVVNAVSSL